MSAPRRSLQRLRAALSPKHSESSSTSHTAAPSTPMSMPSRSSSVMSMASFDSPSQLPWTPDTWVCPSIPQSKAHRAIRKQNSTLEITQFEEREQILPDLLGLIEPRPCTGVANGGIEQVLAGEI